MNGESLVRWERSLGMDFRPEVIGFLDDVFYTLVVLEFSRVKL